MTPTSTEALAALMKLADEFASCAAKTQLESLYGTSKSYTEQCLQFENKAREALAVELRRLSAVEAELERERMRLTACGVVACSDTPASAAVARDMHPDYRSASCDDVARRVDECISLRAERDALRAALQAIRHRTECTSYRMGQDIAGMVDAAMKGTQA